jgi:capsular polysaccharide biosynthesis protein
MERMSGTSTTGPSARASLGQVFVSHARLLLIAVVVGATVGLVVASILPESYRAETTLYLADADRSGLFGATPPTPVGLGSVAVLTDRATSTERFEETAERLSDTSAAEVRARLTVLGDADAGGLVVAATAESPEDAARTLQAFVETVEADLAADRQAWAEATVGTLTPLGEDLRARLDILDTELAGASAVVAAGLTAERAAVFERLLALEVRASEVLADATITGAGTIRGEAIAVPDRPVTPGSGLLLVVGSVLGLLVGVTVGWRRLERDPRVGDRRDPLQLLGTPLVGELDAEGNVAPTGRRGRFSAARPGPGRLRVGGVLRALIDTEGDATPTLLVRGVGPGDAADQVALAVGMSAAKHGRRVIVCGVPSAGAGRRHRTDAPDTARAFVAGSGTVRVIPEDTPPATVTADLVVVSAPPVLSASDGSAADSSQRPRVVLAVNRGRPLDQLVEAGEILQLDGEELLGYVYVDAPLAAPRRRRRSAARQHHTADREVG